MQIEQNGGRRPPAMSLKASEAHRRTLSWLPLFAVQKPLPSAVTTELTDKVQAKYKLPSPVCARPIWTDTSTKGRRGFSVFTLHSVRINRWRGIFFCVSVLAASSYGSRGLDEIFREQKGMWGHGVHFAPLMRKELQEHGGWCQRGHVVICATQCFLKGAK